ncbi:pilus assembly protein TapA [Glaciimonas sp. PCH181]|uniref:pilin n=1 Tax=Glaciimonas sp. PCH181 TaxID=2133943 RepID=UPI000D3A4252|nr:pilus assembly protein TapA [Glaciimonas sp. PCH181]
MAVVAIIGVLAAIALPAYQDYVVKAKFAEAYSVAAPYKTLIAVCMQITGDKTKCDSGKYGIPVNGLGGRITKHVKRVYVNEATIFVVMDPMTFGLEPRLVLSAHFDRPVLIWDNSGSSCLEKQIDPAGKRIPVLCTRTGTDPAPSRPRGW